MNPIEEPLTDAELTEIVDWTRGRALLARGDITYAIPQSTALLIQRLLWSYMHRSE